MSLLFETIKVVNKKLLNLSYHNERLNRTRFEIFKCTNELNLSEFLKIPANISNDVYKYKVIYADEIKGVEFRRYIPKTINKLRLVNNEIDYSYKYLDRTQIEILLKKNCEKDDEDILIVKNGRITDTSFSNIVLFDGKEWCTPKFPLLKGTKRAKLLNDKKIIEKDIMIYELKNYEQFVLINAMMEFEPLKAKFIEHTIIK